MTPRAHITMGEGGWLLAFLGGGVPLPFSPQAPRLSGHYLIR